MDRPAPRSPVERAFDARTIALSSSARIWAKAACCRVDSSSSACSCSPARTPGDGYPIRHPAAQACRVITLGGADQLRLGEYRRCRPDASYPHDPRWIAWNLWRAACSRRAEGRWVLCWPKADCSADASGRDRARASARRRSTPITTRQATDHHPASDLVRRNFMAERPNELWVADITFLPTLAGFPLRDQIGMQLMSLRQFRHRSIALYGFKRP